MKNYGMENCYTVGSGWWSVTVMVTWTQWLPEFLKSQIIYILCLYLELNTCIKVFNAVSLTYQASAQKNFLSSCFYSTLFALKVSGVLLMSVSLQWMSFHCSALT